MLRTPLPGNSRTKETVIYDARGNVVNIEDVTINQWYRLEITHKENYGTDAKRRGRTGAVVS